MILTSRVLSGLAVAFLGCFSPAPPAAAPPADDCAVRCRRVLSANESLAAGLRDGEAAPEAQTRRARSLRDECRQVLAECSSGATLTPAELARVEIVIARLDLILNKVEKEETRQELQASLARDELQKAVDARHKAYLASVIERVEAALARLEPGDAVRLDGIKVLGQAAAAAHEFSRARDAYELFLGEFELVAGRAPAEAAEVTNWLATVYQRLELSDEGIALLQDALERYRTTPSAPQFLETLWTLCLAKGDIACMSRTSQRIREEIPRRLAEPGLSRRQELLYRNYVIYHSYRQAQAALASGDAAGAEALLDEHLAAVAAAEEAGGALPEWRVYRDLATALRGFLRDAAGRPAPSLDLGPRWLDGGEWQPAEARGKVVAILFRLIDEPRSAGFLERISKACDARDDVELVVVSFLRGGDSTSAMERELAALGFRGRAGAVRDRAVLDAFHAWIGSATFVVIDRAGDLQWFQLDPRAIDARFAAAIIERLRG